MCNKVSQIRAGVKKSPVPDYIEPRQGRKAYDHKTRYANISNISKECQGPQGQSATRLKSRALELCVPSQSKGLNTPVEGKLLVSPDLSGWKFQV